MGLNSHSLGHKKIRALCDERFGGAKLAQEKSVSFEHHHPAFLLYPVIYVVCLHFASGAGPSGHPGLQRRSPVLVWTVA